MVAYEEEFIKNKEQHDTCADLNLMNIVLMHYGRPGLCYYEGLTAWGSELKNSL